MANPNKRPSETPELEAPPSPKSQKTLHPDAIASSSPQDISSLNLQPPTPQSPPSSQNRPSPTTGNLVDPIENMRLRTIRTTDGANNNDTPMSMGPATPQDDDTDDMFPEADKPIPSSSSGVALAMGAMARGGVRSAANSSSLRQQFQGSIPGLPNVSAAIDSFQSTPDGQKVHARSGYTWARDEDAPGYLWMNKKAQEEHSKAIDQIVDKDRMIMRKYGDIGLQDYPKTP